ncbi:HRDC domain-containing protein [Paenibacillus sp. LHD-117]|uniref:HRDC domain-containing protein n=1 Tax=Paenibacillus sp. LHD-117 TaxID=3071412 RepID=UPI0027DEAEA2|nr:HRDC domain-containing protein [Paenibacillus sp. LHD-117]MDQ6422367.1 HRDC domain-containing protein [Paenibacillus sp. LHD-117]
MQIVFMNTFEKHAEGAGNGSARLFIGEDQGQWSVEWQEEEESGQSSTVWFEGTSWEEMITSFRHGVAKVMGAGYAPVIDGMLEGPRTAGGGYMTMLHCYGELNADQELFQALREWRRKAAAAEKKSAYLVATNRMLWMISAFVPQTEEELNQIPGWGKMKHASYGADVLAVTAEASRSTPFPLDWVEDRLDPDVYAAWQYKQKENKYKLLMDRQQEKKRILTVLQQGGQLKQLEEDLSLSRRELLIRIEDLEAEGYDVEPFVDRELSEVPQSEQQLIWDAMAAMGDRYLKPVLEQVYGQGEDGKSGRQVEQWYERLRLMRIRYRRKSGSKAV